MKINAMGLDLAKNVFQVYGVDEKGKPVLSRCLKRAQMLVFFARLEPCLIGMEACGSAHYWGRQLAAHGHEVRLIAPQYVKPYVKTNKNDARDAEAICEALLRPSMRFVALKSPEQQGLLALHRLRQGLLDTRTALINQLRGLLAEYGLVVPVGRRCFEQGLPGLIADTSNAIPSLLRQTLEPMRMHLLAINQRIAELEHPIKAWHEHNEASRRAAQVPGVGVLTASAAVATMGDPKGFDSGRGFAAWLGMTPGQHSSGGKTTLLGITKRGDAYLRKLFIHGARSLVRAHRPGANPWLDRLLARRPKNVAVVALAQRNARTVWALLARRQDYVPRGQAGLVTA